MQDSIDSDFLRKSCFECEQHLKINLAQPSVMHNSCSVPFRIVMLLFLFMTKAAAAHVFDWIFYYWESYRFKPVSSPPWHIQWRCTPVFVTAQMFPWWWSVTSQSTGMCIIKCIQTEEQSRVDMVTDSTSSKITLWSLGCSIWAAKSKHSHLLVCNSFLLSDY